MKKAIFTIIITLIVIGSVVIWLTNASEKPGFEEIIMILGLAITILFAVFVSVQRMRDARAKLPTDDEFSKNIMRRAAATAYYVSIYFWLVVMYFESRIDIERSTLIGAGILGMSLIFAFSWFFHRYIKKSHG